MNTKRILTVITGIVVCAVVAYRTSAMPTVYPKGVTIYYPGKCYNGYTVYKTRETTKIIDMNGRIVHTWITGGWFVRPPFKNGNLMVLKSPGCKKYAGELDGIDPAMLEDPEYYIATEYDWNGKVVWRYSSKERLHHDFWRTANGNTIFLRKEWVPVAHKALIDTPEGMKSKMGCDSLVEIDPSGNTVWEWHAYDHLDINRYCPLCGAGDWMHANTVQELPENILGAEDSRFKKGNILINARNHDMIYIIDKETKEVVWAWGDGVLDHPHQPTMLENGTIVLFDNGMHRRSKSRILEIDPVIKEIIWCYMPGQHFYSAGSSGVQKLPNGNVLIREADGRRIFEVTPEKEIVWEFVTETKSYRAFRIPYDYCPQLAALAKPSEVPVIPGITYKVMIPVEG